LPNHRALGLMSGGLDSALAARLLIDQGLEVIGLHLESPTACRSDVREVARTLDIRLEVRPKGEEYLRLLRSPRFGYGKNMNPCVDCRVFMLHAAKRCMEEVGAEFVFTGEVVGQRPMSQSRNSLTLIDADAGLTGRILRPLSARLLPMTEPERRGLVDRERLLSISGRGRETQLALAARLGLQNYESPGGGCLLTDANFSAKLRDLFTHVPEERTTLEDVRLLRLGRHFRVRDDLKIVLGRNQDENRQLSGFTNEERWLIEPENWNGPNALVCGPRGEGSLQEALVLMARYSRSPQAHFSVHWHEDGQERRVPLGAAVSAGTESGAGRV
jgi:tRNA-uridine 2-sulfurtransferase